MPVLQMRIAITTKDFDNITTFFRDGLGLDPGELWKENGGYGQIFDGGSATLEVFDDAYAAHIDNLEAGTRVSGQIRFAFQVPDVQAAVENALRYGAKLVQSPKIMPWGDYNARIQSPDGFQVTLFQVIGES